MSRNRRPTAQELALVGQPANGSIPDGGRLLRAEYFCGSGSAATYVSDVSRELHCSLFEGSLNLRLLEPVTLEDPRTIRVRGVDWEAVPAILDECAVGIHAWRRAEHDATFLEIFAPLKLAPELDVKSGDAIAVRLLPGSLLKGAA